MRVALPLSLSPESAAQVQQLVATLGRVADNQEKIVALHEENSRLLAAVASQALNGGLPEAAALVPPEVKATIATEEEERSFVRSNSDLRQLRDQATPDTQPKKA